MGGDLGHTNSISVIRCHIAKHYPIAKGGAHNLYLGYIHEFALFFILRALHSKKKVLHERQKIKIIAMSGKTPPPLSPDAPPPAATNVAVALSLLAPPSPSSPTSPRRTGAGNLFCDASEKQVSDLVSAGYSPAKKRIGRHTHGASSSPRNAVILADDASSDDSNDKDYSPTLIVRITQPKKHESNITLDSIFSIPSSGDVRYANVFPQTSSYLLRGGNG